MRRSTQRGATTVEMTLIGIPIIFILISVFEMSRGMWMYHTLAYAARDGVRYTVTHGVNCVNTTGTGGTNPNSCTITIGAANTATTPNLPAIATLIQNSAVGPDPTQTLVTFTAGKVGNTTSTSCYLAASTSNPFGSKPACSTLTSQWPPDNYNSVGTPIQIEIKTPFHSALSMFWPGSHPVTFALVNFYATSKDFVQF